MIDSGKLTGMENTQAETTPAETITPDAPVIKTIEGKGFKFENFEFTGFTGFKPGEPIKLFDPVDFKFPDPFYFNFKLPTDPKDPIYARPYRPPYESPRAKRDRLIGEVKTIEELCSSFDLSAFPLPMRVAMHQHQFWCGCGAEPGVEKTIHIFMKVKPRDPHELGGVARDATDGTVELRSCAGVSAQLMKERGNAWAVEKVREFIKQMTMHEVYEALMFKGERIMNPHSYDLKPADQLF
jgi:hypothetical protein